MESDNDSKVLISLHNYSGGKEWYTLIDLIVLNASGRPLNIIFSPLRIDGLFLSHPDCQERSYYDNDWRNDLSRRT